MHSTRFVAFSAVSAIVVTAASCTSLLGDFDTPSGDETGGATTVSSSHHSSTTHTSSTSRTSTTHSSTRASSGSGGDAGGPANGGGGSSAGGGGNGGMGGCNTASDCAPPQNSCEDSTCVGGVCGTTEIAPGLPARNQVPGDCSTNICDGVGNSTPMRNDNDLDDNNECTHDSCGGGQPHHSANTGMRCNNNTQYCNDMGACVQCLDFGDCPGNGACDPNFNCHAPDCTDSIKNQGETDKDCGGPCTTKCADTQRCADDTDCESDHCDSSGICRAQTCFDMTLSGDESDTDCGGSCTTCTNGKKCTSGTDCSSAFCQTAVCRPQTCKDMIKSGNETDIDCGGIDCVRCTTGMACLVNGDCASGICIAATLTCM